MKRFPRNGQWVVRLWAVLVAGSLLFGVVGAAMAQSHAAITPAPRTDDWWQARFKAMNERVKQGNADLIWVGDSITQGWEGQGKEVWAKFYEKRKAVNLGISGDQTQHVLWRLENGNLEGIKPKLAVVMIGTNNYKVSSAEEIAEGITAIVKKLREKLPTTQVLLLAIFPREEKPGEVRAKLAKASELASKAADGKTVHYLDIGAKFLEADGTLPKAIMPDALHPNAKGYEIWANTVEPKIAELLGETKAK